MEHTSGSADASRESAGKLNDPTPSPFSPRPTARAYSHKPSPSREWLQGPAGLLGVRLDVLRGPDAAHGQCRDRGRELRRHEQLNQDASD